MPAQESKKLSNEQKISFVLLLIFAIFALGLGVLKIRNTMYQPFALTNAIPPSIKNLADNINSLQYRDTDFDGLNDFEELYVYQTSPYLEDTDSDGVKDKDEVAKGTSPTCASGKVCSGVLSARSATAGRSTSSLVNVMPPAGKPPVDLNTLLKDPKLLRQALLNSGLEKSILDQLTDVQLLAIVKEAMPSTSTLPSLLPTN